MSDTDKYLLPCPFCGSGSPRFQEVVVPETDRSKSNMFTKRVDAVCQSCGASAPGLRWNQRDQLSELLDWIQVKMEDPAQDPDSPAFDPHESIKAHGWIQIKELIEAMLTRPNKDEMRVLLDGGRSGGKSYSAFMVHLKRINPTLARLVAEELNKKY